MTEVQGAFKRALRYIETLGCFGAKPFFVCIFSGDPLIASSSQALPPAF